MACRIDRVGHSSIQKRNDDGENITVRPPTCSTHSMRMHACSSTWHFSCSHTRHSVIPLTQFVHWWCLPRAIISEDDEDFCTDCTSTGINSNQKFRKRERLTQYKLQSKTIEVKTLVLSHFYSSFRIVMEAHSLFSLSPGWIQFNAGDALYPSS